VIELAVADCNAVRIMALVELIMIFWLVGHSWQCHGEIERLRGEEEERWSGGE